MYIRVVLLLILLGVYITCLFLVNTGLKVNHSGRNMLCVLAHRDRNNPENSCMEGVVVCHYNRI